jgi:hypothetical protein
VWAADSSAVERGVALDTKAGSIAGFSGTALTLSLTLGRPLLQQRFAASAWAHGVIRDAFLASAVLFAAAAIAAVVGVLRPSGTHDLDETAIDAYADRPKVITPPQELRATWLQTVTAMALSDRKAGNAKVDASSCGGGAVVTALAGSRLPGLRASSLVALEASLPCARSMHVRVRPSVAAFDRAGGVAGTEDTAAFGPWAVARSWRAPSGVGRAGEPAIGDERGAQASRAAALLCSRRGWGQTSGLGRERPAG